MKFYRLQFVMMIVLLCLASGLVHAQDATATQEPAATISLPTQPLMPCPANITATTICDMMATQPKDIIGVWSLYFQGNPAFMRYNLDGTWVMGNSVGGTSIAGQAITNGTYSFDAQGVFTSFALGIPVSIVPQECQAGSYLLRVIMVGGQRVALNQGVIKDCFVNRRTDWAFTMLWAGTE